MFHNRALIGYDIIWIFVFNNYCFATEGWLGFTVILWCQKLLKLIMEEKQWSSRLSTWVALVSYNRMIFGYDTICILVIQYYYSKFLLQMGGLVCQWFYDVKKWRKNSDPVVCQLESPWCFVIGCHRDDDWSVICIFVILENIAAPANFRHTVEIPSVKKWAHGHTSEKGFPSRSPSLSCGQDLCFDPDF